VPAWLAPSVDLGLVTLLASFTNGLLGAGGAILFVPLALYVLPALGTRLEPHLVTALSLVQGVCAFLAGIVSYGRRGQVAYRQLWLSGPTLGAGALAGGVLSVAVPARALVLLFALVVTAAAVLLVLPLGETRPRGPAARVVTAGVFLGVGAVGGAVGVGAGVLVIPVLLYVLGTPQRVAIGTGLVLPVFISGPAFVGKAVSGQVPWALVPVVVIAALVGVTLGSRVHLLISQTALRLGLAGLTGALAFTVWVRLLGAA
jgi:uncharacterized membrane protein YfcA